MKRFFVNQVVSEDSFLWMAIAIVLFNIPTMFIVAWMLGI